MFEAIGREESQRRRRQSRTRKKLARRDIYFRRLVCEVLEDRRLLSMGTPQVDLFRVSPALFVENQGQWADASIRYLHQGDGANVAIADAGPVFQVFRRGRRKRDRSDNGKERRQRNDLS